MPRERFQNNRRSKITYEFLLGDPGAGAALRYVGSIGFHEDGRPGEVFLVAGKPGMPVEAACRDAAVLASLLLQYGASLREIQDALTQGHDGTAAGPIGKLLELYQQDPAFRRDGGAANPTQSQHDGPVVPDL